MNSAPLSRPTQAATPRRIVLTTFGSLGDLHPYLAIAQELQTRGHDVVIATTLNYREKVESLGIGFHALCPDRPDLSADRSTMRRIMDRRKGSEFVIRELVLPLLRDCFRDTLEASAGADLLVSHVLTYATPLVADVKGIPWVGSFLQPLGFFSACDPPVFPQVPFLSRLRCLGPGFHRLFYRLAKRTCRSWADPVHRLRAELRLPPTPENPLFESFSPFLTLALFSRYFASEQPDWPAQTVVTGFPILGNSGAADLPAELARFLDNGPPPIVFTVGSSGFVDARTFFETSAAAARLLGRRAVLIVGPDPENRPETLSEEVSAFEYAEFSALFPAAAAIVHAGGIGTTALAMRSGRPMLVVPRAHDQFDNAARATRLGIARTLNRRHYRPGRVAKELERLLADQSCSDRATRIGESVAREHGSRAAADALERLACRTKLQESHVLSD
jgi:UDP:flavonoid glycosyltransferase YjiC (YdhE family)